MIEAIGLAKQYADFQAVRGLDFSIEPGEIVGLLGPNGAGKTTTMRMLTTFLAPTGGTARVAGFDICTHAAQVRKQIGYLPETPALYPELTVTEFVRFMAKIKGVPRSILKSRLDQTLEQCVLGEVRDRLCGQLSRGFRQRVGLAAAIVHRPQVIILDEPTSGLDPAQIIDIRKLIRSLREDHTVILSTHILPEVAETCSHVIIIARGSIVAQGPLKELTAEHTLEERFLQAVAGVHASPTAGAMAEQGIGADTTAEEVLAKEGRMYKAWIIAAREVRSSFVTPLAYAVAAGFVVLSAFFFFSLLQQYNSIVMQAAMMPSMNPSLNEWVITPFFQTLEIILVFLIPVLTMRSFAEEKRNGTFELLATSAIAVGDLVLGKLFGTLVVLFLMLVLAFVFPLALIVYASPEVAPILIGFFGLVLFSAAYTGIGIAVSACTKNQTIAGVVSVVLSLVLYVIDAPAEKIGGTVGATLNYLAPATHTQLLSKGVLSGADLVYFLSLLMLSVFIANRVLEAQRWR